MPHTGVTRNKKSLRRYLLPMSALAVVLLLAIVAAVIASGLLTTTSPSSSPSKFSPKISPPITPLSALTTLITNVNDGQEAKVTSEPVALPSPGTHAHGRPLVFEANGQTYFAYTETTKPDFNTTPQQTAASMIIIKATVTNPSLSPANIDKSGELVDIRFNTVGYSVGDK